MRRYIILSVALPLSVLAAPRTDQPPHRVINIKVRAPGIPLSPNYYRPAQPEVGLDSWGRPVDDEGFDVYGLPASSTIHFATSITRSISSSASAAPDSDSDRDREYDADSDDDWYGGSAAWDSAKFLGGQGPY